MSQKALAGGGGGGGGAASCRPFLVHVVVVHPCQKWLLYKWHSLKWPPHVFYLLLSQFHKCPSWSGHNHFLPSFCPRSFSPANNPDQLSSQFHIQQPKLNGLCHSCCLNNMVVILINLHTAKQLYKDVDTHQQVSKIPPLKSLKLLFSPYTEMTACPFSAITFFK